MDINKKTERLAANMRKIISDAKYSGIGPEELAEAATVISCMLFSGVGCTKEEYLAAVSKTYDASRDLMEHAAAESGTKLPGSKTPIGQA